MGLRLPLLEEMGGKKKGGKDPKNQDIDGSDRMYFEDVFNILTSEKIFPVTDETLSAIAADWDVEIPEDKMQPLKDYLKGKGVRMK